MGENIMPWALIPFLWLISYSVRLDPDISWNIQSLIIPVSAWIGYRYGIKGVMAVFYASVPLFLFQLNGDVEGLSMRFGADGGTLSTALAFAWFVSSPGNTAAFGHLSTGKTSASVVVVGLALHLLLILQR